MTATRRNEFLNKAKAARSYDNVLEKLKENNFIVINEHNNQKEKIAGVGKYYADGGVVVAEAVAMFDSKYYTTNELVIRNDGEVHLTPMAVGPVCMGTDIQGANDLQNFKSGIEKVYWVSEDAETEYEVGRNARF